MLGLQTNIENAETVRKILIEKNALSTNHKIKKTETTIIFPLTEKVELKDCLIIEQDFEEYSSKNKTLKEELTGILTEQELNSLKTAHDVVGNIAILEIDEPLRKKEKAIGEALIKINKNVETVLRKDLGHDGTYRTQKMKWLAGKKTLETTHKENNVSIKVNVETVYFSPRLSTERKRIMQQVKKGETILVMFSGCAPYPCVLSKNTEAKSITGIEINPEGHRYGLENVDINKTKNVTLINLDVKEASKIIRTKYDRIIMPAPKNAEDFLEDAVKMARQECIIHLYAFLEESDFEKLKEETKKRIPETHDYEEINLVKCGQQSPKTHRVCLEFKITKKETNT